MARGPATDSNVGISVLCPAFVRTGLARSDRNQPEGMGGWVAAGSAVGARFGESLSAGIHGGIEPSQVADTILAAVRSDKLWILTHAESVESIMRRANAIVGPGIPPEVRRMGQ